MDKICPLMSSNVSYSNADDIRETVVAFEKIDCQKEKCAWYIEETIWRRHPAGVQKEVKENKCAITLLSEKK